MGVTQLAFDIFRIVINHLLPRQVAISIRT